MAAPTLEELAAELARIKKEQSEKIVIIAKEKTVRKFSGSNARDFVDEIRGLWDSRSYSGKEKLETVIANVDLDVRAEISCQPDDVQKDPEQLLNVLIEVYGDRRGVSELLALFYQVNQHECETVRAYSHRLKRAFDQLQCRQRQLENRPLEEYVLRDQFIAQLQSTLLRKKLKELVYERKSVTFFDVRDVALRWSEEDDVNIEKSPPASYAAQARGQASMEGVVDRLLQKLEQMETRLAALEGGPGPAERRSPRPRFTADGKPICFKCQQAGHIARMCSQGN